MSKRRGVHQLVVGASPGDAIYDQALLIQATLRDWGYASTMYACNLHPTLVGQVPHFTKYRPRRDDIVLFHYSIGSELSTFVRHLRCTVAMIYHNVTPPEYLDDVSHTLAQLVRQGQAELPDFKDVVQLALADSEFNRQDLIAAGYANTALLPIVLDEELYEVASNEALLRQYGGDAVNVRGVEGEGLHVRLGREGETGPLAEARERDGRVRRAPVAGTGGDGEAHPAVLQDADGRSLQVAGGGFLYPVVLEGDGEALAPGEIDLGGVGSGSGLFEDFFGRHVTFLPRRRFGS